jgi:hypothetical protein
LSIGSENAACWFTKNRKLQRKWQELARQGFTLTMICLGPVHRERITNTELRKWVQEAVRSRSIDQVLEEICDKNTLTVIVLEPLLYERPPVRLVSITGGIFHLTRIDAASVSAITLRNTSRMAAFIAPFIIAVVGGNVL